MSCYRTVDGTAPLQSDTDIVGNCVIDLSIIRMQIRHIPRAHANKDPNTLIYTVRLFFWR